MSELVAHESIVSDELVKMLILFQHFNSVISFFGLLFNYICAISISLINSMVTGII